MVLALNATRRQAVKRALLFAALTSLPLPSVAGESSDEISTISIGRYYWELLYDIVNSSNTGSIIFHNVWTRETSVNVKEFLSEKFSIDSGFTLNNEASISLSLGKITASDKINYTYHETVAEDFIKTLDTGKTIDEKSVKEEKFTIGPRGKSIAYRLVYVTDGAKILTDVVSSQPKKDIIIKIEYKCRKRILGLEPVLEVCSSTFPQRANKKEWQKIRDSIVRNSVLSDQGQFRALVETLSQISPDKDNKLEWKELRDTCMEILSDWNKYDKQVLFIKLLRRFSATHPDNENKVEWGRIRGVVGPIITGLRQIY